MNSTTKSMPTLAHSAPTPPTQAERNRLLSAATDCLTCAIELADDGRLRLARELILTVSMAPVVIVLGTAKDGQP